MAFVGGSSGDDLIIRIGDSKPLPPGYNLFDKTTNAADVISAFSGDDIVYAEGGDDTVNGGNGSDTVFGGSGDDILTGSEGADLLDGGRGNDVLNGFNTHFTNSDGQDTLRGGVGDDTLRGDNFGDLLIGGRGADIFIADQWNRRTAGTEDFSLYDIITDFNPAEGDRLDVSEIGIPNADSLRFILNPGHSHLYMAHYVATEAQGIVFRNFTDVQALLDTAIYDTDLTPRNLSFRSYKSDSYNPGVVTTQHLFGGLGDDTITGGDTSLKELEFADYLIAGPGNDLVIAQRGDDFLMGGQGADTLDGGADADTVSYQYSDRGVTVDLLRGIARGGEAKGDVITNVESVIGTVHGDIMRGTGSETTLKGDEGDDRLDGRGGNDRLYLGKGDDLATGGNGHDWFSGGDGADTVDGGRGNDSVYAGSGDDVLHMGAGHDIAHGVDGNDSLSGGAGRDYLLGDRGNDTLEGGSGADTLESGHGNDSLDGGDGNDRLMSQGGRDVLTGGAGADTFVLQSDLSKMVITDFDPARDTLAFDEILSEATTFAEFKANSAQRGADLVYDMGSDGLAVVVLRNVDISDLSAASFDPFF